MRRPSWDSIWMKFATSIAERSYDSRNKVGAVIVTQDNTQVLAVGYNGNYSGGPNKAESEVPGQSGMIHAEINALLKCDYNNPKGKKVYVTLSPCRACCKAMINGGIKEVIYLEEYRDISGFDFLKGANVKIRKLDLKDGKEYNYK